MIREGITVADLDVERDGAVTIITLNRPDQKNAMTRAMRTALPEIVAEFNADTTQRVAIMTGAGIDAFSAGADLKEMAADAAVSAPPMAKAPDIGGIAASEKPIIAAVNGLAVAGGLELALSCDIRVASSTAWFGAFEAQRGFLAGVAVQILPRLVPYGIATDIVLAGERLSAERALAVGLVQEVVAPEKVMDAALQRAERIAASSPTAVWASKKVMRYWRDLQLAGQQEFYEAVVQRVLLTGDYLEGPAAFAQRRPPKFADGWPDPSAR